MLSFPGLWELRTPENLVGKLSNPFPDEPWAPDLVTGLHLTRLRAYQREKVSKYLEELTMLAHAAIEEMRGGSANVSLNEFYDLLSGVSLFLETKMKDVTLCLAELLERGWIGGVANRRGRDVIQLRQPEVEHIKTGVRGELAGSSVSTERVMEDAGLDYFTAYHVVRGLERGGELEPVEGASGRLEWHWKSDPDG